MFLLVSSLHSRTWFRLKLDWILNCFLMCLSSLCSHSPHSGDVSHTPTHTQRSAGGLSPGVGYQRELQLSIWLRAVLPCRAHLRGEWDVGRRPASVLAWVPIYRWLWPSGGGIIFHGLCPWSLSLPLQLIADKLTHSYFGTAPWFFLKIILSVHLLITVSSTMLNESRISPCLSSRTM